MLKKQRHIIAAAPRITTPPDSVKGTLKINRFDYGLKWNRLQETVAVVSDEVRIELNVEANTPRPPAGN